MIVIGGVQHLIYTDNLEYVSCVFCQLLDFQIGAPSQRGYIQKPLPLFPNTSPYLLTPQHILVQLSTITPDLVVRIS